MIREILENDDNLLGNQIARSDLTLVDLFLKTNYYSTTPRRNCSESRLLTLNISNEIRKAINGQVRYCMELGGG